MHKVVGTSTDLRIGERRVWFVIYMMVYAVGNFITAHGVVVREVTGVLLGIALAALAIFVILMVVFDIRPKLVKDRPPDVLHQAVRNANMKSVDEALKSNDPDLARKALEDMKDLHGILVGLADDYGGNDRWHE